MTAATWGQAHLGDTVRGADQRAWEVVGRTAAAPWAIAGERAAFRLRRGERVVDVQRALSAPVDLISRADHTAEAAAIAALIEQGIRFDVLEERVTQTADPFTAPAAPAEDPVAAEDKRLVVNGRYKLPDPETGDVRTWTRASNFASTLADEYGLTRWKERMVARGVALRRDLVAKAAALDPEEDKDELNKLAWEAKDAAQAKAGANYGTALHKFAERLDRGEALASLKAPAPLDSDLAAYAALRRSAGLKTLAQERVVICREMGAAGRFDQIVEQPPGATKAGKYAVLDLKTGKSLDYGWLEIAIQLAIYANATHMWDAQRNVWVPMPPGVDRDRALVVHLPVGKADPQLYGVNIAEGWKHAQTALAVRAARSGARKLAWLVDPDAEALLLHRIARADRGELAALWERLQPLGKWSEEVNAAAMARMAELQSQPA